MFENFCKSVELLRSSNGGTSTSGITVITFCGNLEPRILEAYYLQGDCYQINTLCNMGTFIMFELRLGAAK